MGWTYGSGVTVVAVDTGERLAIGGRDVVEDHMALEHRLAVATGAVELSECFDSETTDAQGASSVVLQNFVLGSECSTTRNLGGFASCLFLDGERIFAYSTPPDVSERAAAKAVNALDLVGANNHVGKTGLVKQSAQLLRSVTILTRVESRRICSPHFPDRTPRRCHHLRTGRCS